MKRVASALMLAASLGSSLAFAADGSERSAQALEKFRLSQQKIRQHTESQHTEKDMQTTKDDTMKRP